MVEEIDRDIQELFYEFDENGNGRISYMEIYRAMMGMGTQITLEDAKNLIKDVKQRRGQPQGDEIDFNEFKEVMRPKMLEDLINQEDNMEDLRALFIEADVDHSGFLSLDELYSVLLKMGCENIKTEELAALMAEMDQD